MKFTLIFLLFPLATLAQDFKSEKKCLDALSYEPMVYNEENDFTMVISPSSNRTSGQLMVITESGARVLTGKSNGKDSDGLNFVFANPGGGDSYFYTPLFHRKDGRYDSSISGHPSKPPLSPAKDLPKDAYLEAAGKWALQTEKNLSDEKTLDDFRDWLKQWGQDRTVIEKRFRDRQIDTEKRLAGLEECSRVSDKNIQKAALLRIKSTLYIQYRITKIEKEYQQAIKNTGSKASSAVNNGGAK